jgi:hypothetical protein
MTSKSAASLAADYINSDVIALIKNVDSSAGKQDETLLALGDKLAEIKSKIQSDTSIDENKAKSIFSAVKKETAKKLETTDITTINKLVKITTNPVISKFRKEKKLPNRWGTLALLTTLEDSQIETLVTSHSLDNSITRAELKQLVDTSRKIVTKLKASLLIINESLESASDDDIEKLNLALKNLGWRVKKEIKEKSKNESNDAPAESTESSATEED